MFNLLVYAICYCLHFIVFVAKLIGVCTFKAMMKEDRVNNDEESLRYE